MLWFFKYFHRKIQWKNWRFWLETKLNFEKKVDHNIGFWQKRQFFRRKLSKIAENCDHNIGPSLKKEPGDKSRRRKLVEQEIIDYLCMYTCELSDLLWLKFKVRLALKAYSSKWVLPLGAGGELWSLGRN
jgi:hypothetical protein